MTNCIKHYRVCFSLYGFAAFLLQELPYLPWLLWPPADNPLAGNAPVNVFLGTLEQAGGVLTIALLILVVRKSVVRPGFKSPLFFAAVSCLAVYYICWMCYFAGFTNSWLIVLGLSAVVPIYYFFVALWTKNYFAVVTATLFFIGHTGSNAVNYLL